MYSRTHRAFEKGDRADTINLQGSELTAKAKPALGRGEATAGAERRSEEFDVASALGTQPAANFAAADAAQRKQQTKEGSLKEGKVCACRGQILYPSALDLKHMGKTKPQVAYPIGKSKGCTEASRSRGGIFVPRPLLPWQMEIPRLATLARIDTSRGA
jgi:hypothetical protein